MQLKDLEDKHSGKLAFILGSGPSLHFEKMEGIENYVTFTVNASVLKLKQCDYFVTDDQGVTDWDYYYKTCARSTCKKLLYREKLQNDIDHFDADDVVLFDHKCWYDLKTKTRNSEGIKMTKGAELPIVGARTSVGSAVHLAYIMGCDPIVLLGCDCCYMQDKEYFWQFPGEPKPSRLKGYNLPSKKITAKGKVADLDNLEFLEYWANFAKYNPQVNILNGSVNGLLDFFPKLQYVDVLKKYGERKK